MSEQKPDPNSPDLTLEQIDQFLQGEEEQPQADPGQPEHDKTEAGAAEDGGEPAEGAGEGEQPAEPAAGEQPTVPIAELLSERRKRKDSEHKLTLGEERLGAIQRLLEQRLGGQPQQPAEQKPAEPTNPHDRESDPLEWTMWQLEHVTNQLQRSEQERQQHNQQTERQRQMQAFEGAIVAEVSEAGQRSDEFRDAYAKLNGAMFQMQLAMGMNPLQAGERSKQLQLGLIVEGLKNHRSPVETLIGLCEAFGYAQPQQAPQQAQPGNGQAQPNGQGGQPQQSTKTAEMHARGREAAAGSLANMTGGSGTAMPSLKAISEMSDADFKENLALLDKQLRGE